MNQSDPLYVFVSERGSVVFGTILTGDPKGTFVLLATFVHLLMYKDDVREGFPFSRVTTPDSTFSREPLFKTQAAQPEP